MKFTRPLYRELAAHGSTKDTARDTFVAHSDFYHPICRSMVAKDLGVRLPRTLSTSLRYVMHCLTFVLFTVLCT
jgi:Leukotriene A4 hydrolase, C-terminal